MLTHASLPTPQAAAVGARARELVTAIRERQSRAGGVDALLSQYDLSSSEGIVLMCLAEALLRIPDSATADRLIADKLGAADWAAHLGESESLFVNASTWALLLTGRFVRPERIAQSPAAFLQRLIDRIGETVVRSALRQAMKILGQQFVMGETIEDALRRAARSPEYSYSFDMLGEAALTAADAERYFGSYRQAIEAAGAAKSAWGEDLQDLPSVSVKLSALSPRYEFAQRKRALQELSGKLHELAAVAQQVGVAYNIYNRPTACPTSSPAATLLPYLHQVASERLPLPLHISPLRCSGISCNNVMNSIC